MTRNKQPAGAGTPANSSIGSSLEKAGQNPAPESVALGTSGNKQVVIAPGAVAEWQPPSLAMALAHAKPREMLFQLQDELELIVGPRPDECDELSWEDEDPSIKKETSFAEWNGHAWVDANPNVINNEVKLAKWNASREAAFKELIASKKRASMGPHLDDALRQIIERSEREMRMNRAALDARKKQKNWAIDYGHPDGTDTIFKKQLHEIAQNIEERAAALIVSGADCMTVLWDVSRVLVRGRGSGSVYDELKYQAGKIEGLKRKVAEPAREYLVNEPTVLAEFVMRMRPELSGLVFSVSNKFWVGFKHLPMPVMKHIAHETLVKSAIIEDRHKDNEYGQRGRVVPVTNVLIQEIVGCLARRSPTVDDRRRRVSENNGDGDGVARVDTKLLSVDQGPAFEKELVLDPKAWTSMDGIRQVVGPMWREWCMRTGRTRAINDDKQLGIWLKAWGRDAIERTRPRPARVPGYRGVRPK